MNATQMLGKCNRLRDEISRAYAATPRNLGYIRRLADEMTVVERAMSASALATQASANESMSVRESDLFGQLSTQPRDRIAEGLVDTV